MDGFGCDVMNVVLLMEEFAAGSLLYANFAMASIKS